MSKSKKDEKKDTIPEKSIKKYTCRGCTRVFNVKNDFNTHILTCIKPVSGEKFQNLYNKRKPAEDEAENESEGVQKEDADKILPLSQPILSQNMEVTTPLLSIIETETILENPVEKTAQISESLPSVQSSPQSITEHMKMTELAVKCTICTKEFNTLRGLNIHMRACKKKQHEKPSTQNVTSTTPQEVITRQEDIPHNSPSKIWGDHTADDMKQIANAMYEEIVFWKKNLFKLPSGAIGKKY